MWSQKFWDTDSDTVKGMTSDSDTGKDMTSDSDNYRTRVSDWSTSDGYSDQDKKIRFWFPRRLLKYTINCFYIIISCPRIWMVNLSWNTSHWYPCEFGFLLSRNRWWSCRHTIWKKIELCRRIHGSGHVRCGFLTFFSVVCIELKSMWSYHF